MKTITPKAKDIQRDWLQVSADGKVLGRLTTKIASLLRGKHKPCFVTNLDTGDYVIVTDCEKIKLTGRKELNKKYDQYSGYPDGLKQIPYQRMKKEKPEMIIKKAVKGMLPKGPLGRQMMRKLKVHVGDQHPHGAQKPVMIEL